jgi:hypothetical protein
VLLPDEAAAWPLDRLRAVLLHEMAHVRRRDWPGHRLADLVCALYWFHPLVWPLARRLRAESEAACDDRVLALGVPAPDYARHLLDVARALGPAAVPPAAIAMARTARLEGRLTMILDPRRPRRAPTRRALLLTLTLGTAAVGMLAALRPAARAQSLPSPVTPPPAALQPASAPPAPLTISSGGQTIAVSPAPVKTKRKAAPQFHRRAPHPAAPVRADGYKVQIDFADHKDPAPLTFRASTASIRHSLNANPPFSVAFSPDVSVNGVPLLAGVTDADKPGGPWWSGAGAILPAPVFNTKAQGVIVPLVRQIAGRPTRRLAFALRLPPSAQDVTVRYQVPQSTGYSYFLDDVWPIGVPNSASMTEEQMFSRTNGCRVLTAEFPASLTRASVRVGIASGPWQTVATNTVPPSLGDNLAFHDFLRGKGLFILTPTETAGGFNLDIGTDAPTRRQAGTDRRLVAVDVQGREVTPGALDMNGSGDHMNVYYALPLSQIKEFRVQTRPFRWVEIKDIALQPAR